MHEDKFFYQVEKAVIEIEESREAASQKQDEIGHADQGLRSQVTSGGHLDRLANVIADVFIDAGLSPEDVYLGKHGVELPGFFRPEKSWDVLAFRNNSLVAAIELKSMWNSYGNNMNNRAEEAIGSGFDFRTAEKYDLFGGSAPWLGYAFVIRDDPTINKPTSFEETHYCVDPDFSGTSYLRRSMVTCRRLMLERVYDRVFYAVYNPADESFAEPDEEMTWAKFEAAIRGKVKEALA